ncbi:MAG: DUF4307 domain-containing protein [Candidatus Nanopelagicales bacterium]|jgi:hypothetical protein
MPSGVPVSQLSPELRDRYGIRPTPWWVYTGIGVVVAAFISAIAWVGYQLGSDDVQSELLAWNVVSAEHVDVTFDVRRSADSDVVCVIRAQDQTRADVGYATVNLPRGTTYVQQTYALRTIAPAYVVELLGCAAGGLPDRVMPPQFPPGVLPPEQPWEPAANLG